MVELFALSAASPGLERWAYEKSKPARDPGAPHTDPAEGVHPAQTEVALHDEGLRVEDDVARVAEPGVVEVGGPGDRGAVEAHLPVHPQPRRPQVVAHAHVVELERGLVGADRGDLGAVHEQRPGDLRPAEPHRPEHPAVRQPQDGLHPHRGGGESGQHGVAEVQLAQPAAVQQRHVVEEAPAEPYGVVDRPVLEAEHAGDPGSRQLEGGYLALLLRPVEHQRAQHPCPHGPFGAPVGAFRRVLVLGRTEVHGLAPGEGTPHPQFGRRHIVDLHQRRL